MLKFQIKTMQKKRKMSEIKENMILFFNLI